MLDVGDTPENFELSDQAGEPVAWADFRGKPVVVFFYPKASTPGCTTEACAFTDLSKDFADRGVAVVGVSADTVKRQSNFATKYSLSMPLLADTEKEVLEAWGVWGEKKNYGRTYLGIHRSTFLFDKDGTVAFAWPKVRVKGHAEAVLAKVAELDV